MWCFLFPQCSFLPLQADTPLHLASYEGKAEVAECLLRHGANRDLENNAGNTALETALVRGHVDCVKLLLAWRARVRDHTVE